MHGESHTVGVYRSYRKLHFKNLYIKRKIICQLRCYYSSCPIQCDLLDVILVVSCVLNVAKSWQQLINEECLWWFLSFFKVLPFFPPFAFRSWDKEKSLFP